MPGFNNGVMWANNVRFDGTAYPGEVTADGQLLIGSTAAPNIKVGTLTSTGGTVVVTPGSGTINLEAGSGVPTTFTEDSGTATPAANNINVEGGTSVGGIATNINTIGSGSTVQVCLNNSISLPSTSAAGTSGVISIGGSPFAHSYTPGITPNTFVGKNAGNLTNTSVGALVAIGENALNAVTTGLSDTAVGNDSLKNLTTGGYNTCVGRSSGESCSGSNNTFIGYQSGLSNSGADNTALGYGAFIGSSNPDNVAIGKYTMWNGGVATTNNQCTAVGSRALTALSGGTNDVAIGGSCLISLTTGNGNVCVGSGAGYYLTTGHGNLILSQSLGGENYTSSEGYNIILGMSKGTTGEDHVMRLGSDGTLGNATTKTYVSGVTGVAVSNTQMVAIDSSTGQLGVMSLNNIPTWSVITASQSAVAGQGYFVNGVGAVTVTLPATSAIGDIFEVSNMGIAAGTIIAQNAGQNIRLGSSSTTPGVGGSLTSTALGDSLKLVCNVANTTWTVVSSMGNWSIV